MSDTSIRTEHGTCETCGLSALNAPIGEYRVTTRLVVVDPLGVLTRYPVLVVTPHVAACPVYAP